MKTPGEWAKFEFENPLIKTGDFIEMIQKDAYNQAIEDALNNIQYVDYDKDGDYCPVIDEDSILKLKIK